MWLFLLCQNGINRYFLSSQMGKSIADDVVDLLAFSDPVPDPFSSNNIVGRGGVNQIEWGHTLLPYSTYPKLFLQCLSNYLLLPGLH